MSASKPTAKDMKAFCRLVVMMTAKPDFKLTPLETTFIQRMMKLGKKEYERERSKAYATN